MSACANAGGKIREHRNCSQRKRSRSFVSGCDDVFIDDLTVTLERDRLIVNRSELQSQIVERRLTLQQCRNGRLLLRPRKPRNEDRVDSTVLFKLLLEKSERHKDSAH